MIAHISASQEDYLEVIYDLSHDTEAVRSIDIAKKIKVSRASVNKRLGLLKEAGFVEHEPYGLVRLTEKGFLVAKNVRERHNALYQFLTDVLDVPADLAAKEACEMEHAISQETSNKLYAYLRTLDKAPNPTAEISETQKIQTSYTRIIE
ncbi:MAG: metal-dependent transcriptional regulator [Treponema sp.]